MEEIIRLPTALDAANKAKEKADKENKIMCETIASLWDKLARSETTNGHLRRWPF